MIVRNSEVWQGTMGNVNVAIKMFASNHRQLFLNEKYIYSLPFMEHENLLKFYGCDERLTMEINATEHTETREIIIVLSL
jgi:bone morphogenetic protein receptor type-2